MYIQNFLNKIKKYREGESVNLEEIKDILKSNKEAILLDVRSNQEYKEGHLNGAINIPLYELESCCDCKLDKKDEVIIVYCQSGIRSKKAIKILKKCGFTNLYHLNGGLDEM